jgi:class 3 adenylate cyclase
MMFRGHLARVLIRKPPAVNPGGDRPDTTDVESALRIRNRELVALLEISQTLAKTLEAEELLGATLDKSMEILGLDVGYVRTLDDQRKNLVVRVARGLSSREFLTTAFPLNSPAPIVGKTVFKTQMPHISADVRKDPEFMSRTLEREGLVSLAMVPIASKADVHGFIALGSKRSHDFSGVELGLISNFSSQLGTALTNAYLFNSIQARAAELEQRMHERSAEVKRLERLKRFVSPRLAEMILVDGPNDPLEAHRREITVVVAALRGFTAFTARSEPEEVMTVLRQYHYEIGRLILKYGGTLERFAGERVMILFNDPIETANPAERAVRMTYAMRERVRTLSQEWYSRGHELSFGAGIAHGYATLGSVGFGERIDYAAIGRVPNLASCLCDRADNNQILISRRVWGMTEEVVNSEPIENLTFDWLPTAVKAHTVLHLKDSLNI